MKLGPAIVIWFAATYLADQYYFFGRYFDAAKQMLRQILDHVL
ncbi:MAG: hypothetical protein ACXWJW_09530 [Xanthobacteraceae bacterium]